MRFTNQGKNTTYLEDAMNDPIYESCDEVVPELNFVKAYPPVNDENYDESRHDVVLNAFEDKVIRLIQSDEEAPRMAY